MRMKTNVLLNGNNYSHLIELLNGSISITVDSRIREIIYLAEIQQVSVECSESLLHGVSLI